MNSPTKLLLMRHAHAVSETEDPDRPLSEKGRRQAEDMASFLMERQLPKIERVWHSPLLRSRQTADVFCDLAGVTATRRMIDGLLPYDDIEGVARRLSGFGHTLLVVGHEPHLSMLAARLLTGDSGRIVVQFPKAGLLCLEREEPSGDPGWSICWFITPKLIRRQPRS